MYVTKIFIREKPLVEIITEVLAQVSTELVCVADVSNETKRLKTKSVTEEPLTSLQFPIFTFTVF